MGRLCRSEPYFRGRPVGGKRTMQREQWRMDTLTDTTDPHFLPRVLVVEDDVNLREAVADFLTGKGCEVRHAANGPLALEAMDDWELDVVLMDLRLPGMDGVEAAQLIRQRRPQVQVIFLTAHDDSVVRASVLKEGAYGYLIKGCQPYLIAEMVYAATLEGRSTP